MQKIVSSDRSNGDRYGNSVSISNEYVVCGALFEDEDAMGLNTITASGSAYVYELDTGLGIDESDFGNSLKLYPNPTKGMLYINGDTNKIQSIEIFSITGQYVMKVKDNFREIDITKLSPALYFVKLITEESTGTIKIIKE